MGTSPRLSKAGLTVTSFGIRHGARFDVLDDTIWHPLLSSISSGSFQAFYACPPSSSFRSLKLRNPSGAARYGVSKLGPSDAGLVRKQNLLIRSLEAMQLMVKLGGSAIVDLLANLEGASIMKRFDEAASCLSMEGVQSRLFPRSRFVRTNP